MWRDNDTAGNAHAFDILEGRAGDAYPAQVSGANNDAGITDPLLWTSNIASMSIGAIQVVGLFLEIKGHHFLSDDNNSAGGKTHKA